MGGTGRPDDQQQWAGPIDGTASGGERERSTDDRRQWAGPIDRTSGELRWMGTYALSQRKSSDPFWSKVSRATSNSASKLSLSPAGIRNSCSCS